MERIRTKLQGPKADICDDCDVILADICRSTIHQKHLNPDMRFRLLCNLGQLRRFLRSHGDFLSAVLIGSPPTSGLDKSIHWTNCQKFWERASNASWSSDEEHMLRKFFNLDRVQDAEKQRERIGRHVRWKRDDSIGRQARNWKVAQQEQHGQQADQHRDVSPQEMIASLRSS